MFWRTESAPTATADVAAASPPSFLSNLFKDHQLVLRYSSLAVLGMYAVAIAYRVGAVQKVLPAAVYDKIEQKVEAIKAKTKPIGDAKRFALARAHLTKVYTLASLTMTSFVAGILAFVAQPHIPIVIPVITTVIPVLLVLGVPKHLMLRGWRLMSLFTAFFSAGYAFGPLGWVAQDSLFLFLLCTFCTMTGLVVPLFITRGLISYLLSSQVLSLTLSVSFFTAPKEARLKYSPFNVLKKQDGVQMILNADYNVLLTLQMGFNLLLVALHTLPTMYYFVSADTGCKRGDATKADAASQNDDPDAVLLDSKDDIREACCICAGWTYLLYRFVKHYARFLVEKVINEDVERRKGKHNKGDNAWQMLAERKVDLNGASGMCAGLLMFLFYIKAVSVLQRGDPEASLEQFRYLCKKFSPLEWVLRM